MWLRWSVWTRDYLINPQSFYCLYLMEYEGKYLEKYLNTLQKYLNIVIKYKWKNVFKYSV